MKIRDLKSLLISQVISRCDPLAGKKEFMVVGLLANLCVGIVSRFRSSLLATGFPVISRTGFSPVAL